MINHFRAFRILKTLSLAFKKEVKRAFYKKRNNEKKIIAPLMSPIFSPDSLLKMKNEKKKSTVILLSLHYLSFSIDPLHCWVIEKENCRLSYTSVVSSFILFSFIYSPPPPPHTLANWQNGRSDGIFHDPERSFTANKHSLG